MKPELQNFLGALAEANCDDFMAAQTHTFTIICGFLHQMMNSLGQPKADFADAVAVFWGLTMADVEVHPQPLDFEERLQCFIAIARKFYENEKALLADPDTRGRSRKHRSRWRP